MIQVRELQDEVTAEPLAKVMVWQYSAIMDKLEPVMAQDDTESIFLRLSHYKLVMTLPMGAKIYEALDLRLEECDALYVIDCSLEGSRRQDFVKIGYWPGCLRFIELFGLR